MRDGDSDLVSASPDLAASVVALHAEVERAATAERARIVAWLKERSDTAYAAGNEPRGDALLNASRVLQGGPVTAPRIISAAVAREAAQPKPWRSPIVQRAHDEADHDYAETTLDRDDRPIRPTCAYCGRSTPYCKGRKP
jgi:hypothetical protein